MSGQHATSSQSPAIHPPHQHQRRAASGLQLHRKLKFSVGFSLTIVLIAALIVESVPHPQPPLNFPFYNKLFPYVGFRPPSNYTWRSDGPSASSRDQQTAIVYTNESGFRIAAPETFLPKCKPSGTVRVAMLGGSTVYSGTDFTVTLPGALQRELNARFPGAAVEVINAGIISAIARQQLIHLITSVVDYNVDIVVNYDGINDSGQMLYFEHRPNYPYNFCSVSRQMGLL